MLAPKARTNLPFESNFWIGAIVNLQPFAEQRSNTQMLLPSLWSTWTLMAPPSLRPSGSCSQLSCILYGLGAALGSAACAQSRSPAIPVSAPAAAAIITVARNAWLHCSVDIWRGVRRARQTGVSPLSKRR